MTHNENPVMLTVEEAKSIMDALQEAGHQLQRFTELFADDPELVEGAEQAEVQVAGAFGMIEDALQASGN